MTKKDLEEYLIKSWRGINFNYGQHQGRGKGILKEKDWSIGILSSQEVAARNDHETMCTSEDLN